MTEASVARVGDLDRAAFESCIAGRGIGVRFGPFDVHLTVSVRDLWGPLHQLYRDYPRLQGPGPYTCRVSLDPVRSWRRWRTDRVRLRVDGRPPHEDMPLPHALAVLEWGLNLVIALRHQAYLMLHAAAVERNGRVLLLPASPGHGKTTLCAGLVHRGWRFLSDEFGLVRPTTREAIPVPRPLPLKNASIGVIREFAPEAHLGPQIPGTRKGTVAHLRPPATSVAQADRAAPIAAIVFPRWSAGSALALEPVRKGHAFMELATHAFNYEVLGHDGFGTVRDIVAGATCHRLAYSSLDDAVRLLTSMSDEAGA